MSIPKSLLKIAIFVPSTAIGGAEHYIRSILPLVKEIGFSPTLVVPDIPQIINFFSGLEADLLISDIAWQGDAEDLTIGETYLNKLSQQYRAASKILESLKPDCIFINLPWLDFGLGLSLASYILNIPCTNLVHLCPWKVELNDLTKKIFQSLAVGNSKFFTVSYDNKIQLSLSTGINLNQIKVFYNSRDIVSEYTSLTSKQYKLRRLELLDELELPLNSSISLSVGRFSHQKNFLDIITSFSLVQNKLPNYYHLFLGEGELKDYYQKIALDLGLSNKLKFLGYRKDVARFLALSDIFISTSLYEGLALSILEAAQFSCPIIATNSSSAQEIIPSSEYGLLYNPGQYHLLVEHIEYAHFNPNKMKSKATKLRSFCQEKFSMAKFKINLENILRESLNRRNEIDNSSRSVPVFYDQESNILNVKNDFNVTDYNYQGLPKEITRTSHKANLSFSNYTQQVLEKEYHKYLHCLYKISKKFLSYKIILCINSFNTNFFRNYYLKEPYLLLVFSSDHLHRITLSFHCIDHTYWGQDIEPDCFAKFTTFERVLNFEELASINSNKTDCNHFYTSKHLLESYLELSKNDILSNLSINLKLISYFFDPIECYLLEKDSLSEKIDMKLVPCLKGIDGLNPELSSQWFGHF
ncbi:glycosyltransferase [Xenococcus sp. PCC 7305]|uniref:glycosyltransferase n=1 Tax=Xenococcus sp. PCC 7305 TaxID=102125 RepID=UPI0002ACF19A|nr:glycosyltransferase [Xenococcus sp. PCC 7305]ELS03175.1 glycosyltransferase [Xenococcus sp. PCC 7305]